MIASLVRPRHCSRRHAATATARFLGLALLVLSAGTSIGCAAPESPPTGPTFPVVRTVRVHDDGELRAALADLRAGDTVLLAPGTYRGGHMVTDAIGEPTSPIVLAGADPDSAPVIEGGTEALHLTRPRHVTLRNLVVRGQSGNGINVDEGGPGAGVAEHVTVESVLFERIGPTGNHDALKLSGLTDFVVTRCTFEGWGGSAIDMVGCRRGRIEGCTLRGLEGCSQQSGVQAKGGTSDVTIRRCRFEGAGARAVNLGGSTGLTYFRPQDAAFEARNLTVEGCWFRDSDAMVAFVGVDGAVVRRNTFHRPRRWLLRILQETTAPRFVPCREGRFEHNVVVFRTSELHRFVNVGPNTLPRTFSFTGNAWFALDATRPADHVPALPTPETGGLHGIDPRIDPLTLAAPSDAPLRDLGAASFGPQ